jgi:Rieske 2Fe-2S family protein
VTTNPSAVRRDPGYLGLTESVAALPASDYFDAQQYQRELAQIWYRNWLYVCRSSDIGTARSFCTFAVGNQSILVVRGEDQVARFHNTCRHRGAALCQATAGRFPPPASSARTTAGATACGASSCRPPAAARR